MNSIDFLVQNYFSSVRTAGLTEVMYLFSNLFDISVYSVTVFLCVALLIGLVRSARYAYLFISSIIFGSILVYMLKVFFNVSRPAGGVMSVFGQSFPSYHATIATIFFVMLMYIFDDYFKPVSRIIFNTLATFAIFAVAFSRLYLGVHWFSDVFWGIILGALVSYFFIILFRKMHEDVMNRPSQTSVLK